MRAWNHLVFIMLVIMTATACETESESADVAAKSSDDAKSAYDIYQENRESAEPAVSREARLQKRREEKHRLAEAILAEGLVDDAVIEKTVADFRADLVIKQYFNGLVQETVSDDAVRDYYDANTSEFTRERARLAQLTLPFGAEKTPSKEAAFDMMMDAYTQLSTEGSSFPDIAKAFAGSSLVMSDKDSWIELDSIDAQLREVVLAMEAGQVSKPWIRRDEYVITGLLEPVHVETVSFEDARDAIRFKLNNEIRMRERERLLSSY